MPDNNGLEDSAQVALNPTGDSEPGDNLDPVGKRPAKSATVDAWVDYVVDDLGASRDWVTGASEHLYTDEATGEITAHSTAALTKAELMDLADRLGG